MTKILYIAVLLFCLGSGRIVFKQLQVSQTNWASHEAAMILPSAKVIRPLFLGFENVGADFFWIKTLGYFVDEILTHGKLTYLSQLIHRVVDLDPRFEKVYIWAGGAIMYSGGAITQEKVRACNAVLEKGWKFIQADPIGWKHREDYWLIPQMIGFNYAFELRDKEKGAPFIEAASKIPGIPRQFQTWGAYLYNKSGHLDKGIDVLEHLYTVEVLRSQLEGLGEGEAKDHLKGKLIYYYKKMHGEKNAQAKIEHLQKQVQTLIFLWQKEFYYVPFEQFLMLRKSAEPSVHGLSFSELEDEKV